MAFFTRGILMILRIIEEVNIVLKSSHPNPSTVTKWNGWKHCKNRGNCVKVLRRHVRKKRSSKGGIQEKYFPGVI